MVVEKLSGIEVINGNSHKLISFLKETAPLNIEVAKYNFLRSHFDISLLKLVAPLNIELPTSKLRVSHFEISPLKLVAP